MPKTIDSSQAFQDQLNEIQEIMEREKVKLTPEVEAYLHENVQRITEMIAEGQMPSEEDLRFFEDVKMWMRLSESDREEYSSIDKMLGSENCLEAIKRGISVKQWLDLLHVAEATGVEPEHIDISFDFPGGKKIVVEASLDLNGNRSLERLPDNLFVRGALFLNSCTSLKELPENLSVQIDLFLSNCTSLIHLPNNISVEGNLILYNCTSLVHLPEGLSVKEDLILLGCTSLTHLPKNLHVGVNIYLSNNLNEQVKKDAERLKEEGKIKGEIKYE